MCGVLGTGGTRAGTQGEAGRAEGPLMGKVSGGHTDSGLKPPFSWTCCVKGVQFSSLWVPSFLSGACEQPDSAPGL